MSPEPDPSSEASDERKVVVLFKATGDAPILRRNVVKIRASAKFEEILAHLTKSTRCERAFAYLGAAFAPRYDATIGRCVTGTGSGTMRAGSWWCFTRRRRRGGERASEG